METHTISQEQIIEALVYGLIFLTLVTIGVILVFHYSRKKIIEKEIEQVNTKLQHQQKILETTINVQEVERKRIAQDLHDAISSKLNVVSLTTYGLLDEESLDTNHKASLEHILNITTNTLESSRKIAHDLLPPVLDKFGLKVALEELFDEYKQSNKVTIENHIEALKLKDNTEELHIFRIVQELINNAVRHGKATQINVTLATKNDTGFHLEFEDNGVGFDTSIIAINPGLGIQNIKSRANILNSQLHIESIPNKGSKFIIQRN